MSKIMIVDDNKDIVETMSMIMKGEGYAVATASNGEEFLGKVGSVKPEMVLLDVMMPGLTTKQILQELAKKNVGKLKIILVTVVRFSEEEIKSLKKEYNIVDYVTKPFDVPDLVKRVRKSMKG